MIESTFRKTIEQFSDIVEFIEKLELSEEEYVSIVSFPYHKHVGNKIEPSQQMNINDVLSFIREFLG